MFLLILFLGIELKMSAWFWVLYGIVFLLKYDSYRTKYKQPK